MADVVELAGRIGPRGTGTAGERAAGDYVAGRLAALGLPITRPVFRAVTTQNAYPLASVALALAAVATYPWSRAGRWLAAGLALPSGPLLWRAIRLSTNPLRPLLPKTRSGSVITRVAPLTAGSPGQTPHSWHGVRPAPLQKPVGHVVLLAHLDTNRCRLAWRSGGVRWLEPLTWLTLGVLGALALLYATGAAAGSLVRRRCGRHGGSADLAFQADRVWYASLLPAAYVAGMLVTLIRDERTPFSPGAHDNAASVAVALETARSLAERPLPRTEVVLAFTGAEETDHAGLYSLLGGAHGTARTRPRPTDACLTLGDAVALRAASFIGLEGLGSGRLVYLTRSGVCHHVRPDRHLRAVAERVATRHPDLAAEPAAMIVEDEVTNLRRRGYRAITIAGLDPATRTLPHWHQPDDTPDRVSAVFLEQAAAFVRALLDELDASPTSASSVSDSELGGAIP